MIFRWLFTPLLCSFALINAPYASAQDTILSLSLQQAQTLARERNHDLKLIRLAIAAAQANVVIAGVAPNPVLTMQSGSINPRTGIGRGSLWNQSIDSTFRIDQVIERGGKRELRTENARQLERAARDDASDTLRQLDMVVAMTYADLLAAQERRAAAIENAQLLDAMLDAAQKRKNAGDIAGSDVERVKVDMLRAKNDIALADGELSRVRQTLALLIGQAARTDMLKASDAWPSLQQAELAEDTKLEDIIARRADVQAAAARVEAARAGTQFAQALRTRDVTVGLQYEHYPQPGESGAGSTNSYGVSLQMPLFINHYYKGEILAAGSALDTALEILGKTQDAAMSELQSARAALVNATLRVIRNRDELQIAASNAARAAEFAYKNGAVGIMDVLDARRILRATRLDALTALADYSKALAGWKAAMTINETAANPKKITHNEIQN